jgi:methenyltetrahydromethanopterin cyclohydrolase
MPGGYLLEEVGCKLSQFVGTIRNGTGPVVSIMSTGPKMMMKTDNFIMLSGRVSRLVAREDCADKLPNRSDLPA